MDRFLIYGASGKVGSEVAALAVAAGLSPLLAGRSKAHVEPVARRLGLDWVVFADADRGALRDALQGVRLAFHAAGPTGTSLDLLEGCLELGRHYLDIGTQPASYRAVYQHHAAARAAGSIVIPGVGLDVVFGDVLFDHLFEAIEAPAEAAVAYGADEDPPWAMPLCRQLLSNRGMTWQDGDLHAAEPMRFRSVDLPEGSRTAVGPFPLAELVSTSFGYDVPKITAYYLPRQPSLAELLQSYAGKPSCEWEAPLSAFFSKPRAQVRTVRIWAEARSGRGQRHGLIWVPCMTTVEGVPRTMTSVVALRAIQQVLRGGLAPGAWTPTKALGRGTSLDIPGVELQLYEQR